MIFKHLFTPKWKHPKTAVRLAAVDKLDTGKDAEVLQTLALQDSSTEIRKKALHKVNDLVLWWQAYKQDQSLKELAEQQISSAVLNKNDALSDDIRSEYIDKYAPTKLLEKLAFSEGEIQFRVKLLKRLANAKLIERAFKEGGEAVQVALLPLTEQYQLDKAVLKSAQGEAKTAIEQRIEQQRLAKEMPQQVEQQTKMVLAKLNALRDKFDYQQVNEQAKALLSEWQEIELKWLDDEAIKAVDKKFTSINKKLEQHIAKQKAEFEAEQAKIQAEQAKANEIKSSIAAIDAFAQQLAKAISELDEQQSKSLDEQLTQLSSMLAQSEFADCKELVEQRKRIETFAKQLTKIPELIAASKQIKAALEALAVIKPTDEKELLDKRVAEQKSAYDECKAILRQLPDDLQKQASEQLHALSKQFKQGITPLLDEQQNHLKQARRKGKDVQRLIEQGRFNVAFGVFNGFLEHYQQLTENNQQSIEKLYTGLNESLQEVRDWQKYAATPKRAELLTQVDEMLAQTDVDPKKRAEEVKLLRIRWNELGRVDTDEEKAQAQQFDEKIEQLFAPCREFFAQQEQQREEAKQARVQIIEQMKVLEAQQADADNFDWRQFESQFNRLAKQWRTAGSVDGSVYKALNGDYRAVYSSVNERLKSYHQANARLKQQLVEQAQQQLESEDLADACEQLKALQKQWQNIGFAGSKQEHTLWQTFRKHNDAVFSKRSEQFELQKQQQSEHEVEQQAQLDAYASKLHEAESVEELAKLAAEVSALDLVPGLRKLKAALLDKIAQLQQQLKAKQDKQKYVELINAIEAGELLPTTWQQPKGTTELVPAQLMLRLEILADVESPQEMKKQRMVEQVAMLDAKLQGEEVSFEVCLAHYLSAAQSELDTERLLRVLKK
ncbi:DUF349 domain-containing protein [Pseudoalteromonas sp. MMG022]|uniref:DUF349 domain-containing protein n=1 Tax=Pseudoalteromonas sp. MMG022 TaxID=2909978 RepID=UPI001F23C98B|nr:DUF349 domain-containing protein [Pseudoalteromonas sp. MMG022]MCF6435705.1 DUF349 domain-containing protein [Pseudoalteromonas sp. MMG022]